MNKTTLIIFSVLIATPAFCALQSLSSEELGHVSGAQGISIITKVDELNLDISYEDTQDKFSTSKLIIGGVGGSFATEKPMKIDVVNINGLGANDRALQITLPGKISTPGDQGFSLGRAGLSIDDTLSTDTPDVLTGLDNSGKPMASTLATRNTHLADEPQRMTYQAVVTAANYRFDRDGDGKVGQSNDIFNSDIGVNEVQLQIQDVGKDYEGNPTGSGKLKADYWHTMNYNIGEAEINNAIARKNAYAAVDKGNQGIEGPSKDANGNPISISAGSDGIATVGSDEYFFAKGWQRARTEMGDSNQIMEHGNTGTGSSLDTEGLKSTYGYLQTCDSSGANCSDAHHKNIPQSTSASDNGKGIIKYNINLTSRIDNKDTDKIFYNKNEDGNNRYDDKDWLGRVIHPSNIDTNYEEGIGYFEGAGGCYKNSSLGKVYVKCEGRPLSEGLSWYTNNENYKAVSAEEYKNIEAAAQGSQIAHDPRVIFSVGKETEVRLQALVKKCSRWCTHDIDERGNIKDNDLPRKAPRPANRQAVLDPAVVLLDSEGNVIASDVSSGGVHGGTVNGTAINADDDNELYSMGVIEATLGDPFYNKATDRVLSNMRVAMPPEIANSNQVLTQQQQTLHNSLPRAAISTSAKVLMFAH